VVVRVVKTTVHPVLDVPEELVDEIVELPALAADERVTIVDGDVEVDVEEGLVEVVDEEDGGTLEIRVA
jgi:hypothetical protein